MLYPHRSVGWRNRLETACRSVFYAERLVQRGTCSIAGQYHLIAFLTDQFRFLNPQRHTVWVNLFGGGGTSAIDVEQMLTKSVKVLAEAPRREIYDFEGTYCERSGRTMHT